MTADSVLYWSCAATVLATCVDEGRIRFEDAVAEWSRSSAFGERADDLRAQLVPLDQPGIVGEHQVMLNHGVTEGRWARRCW
ncbi:hypothetical protein ACF05F_33320 [Rhodococcus erythropolis]